MRPTLSVRLAAGCGLAAGIAVALLCALGYPVYQGILLHRLDQRITVQYRQIRARLASGDGQLTARRIRRTIRAMSRDGSAPFYIDVRVPGHGHSPGSGSLGARPLAEGFGLHRSDAGRSGVGPLRIKTFDLPPFRVAIGASRREVFRDLRGFVELCSALFVAMLGAGALAGFAVGSVTLRRVRRLRETVRRFGPGRLTERIPESAAGDEIAELGSLLNEMFDRLQHAIGTLRTFTAEASHEIKTPLTLIRLQAEKLLLKGLSAPDEAAVQMQLEELTRLNRILEDLLFLARAESGAIALRVSAQCPRAFLGAFAEDAQALAEHRGRRFELQCDADAPVAFESQRIRQVLLNLLVNALNASPPGGVVRLRSGVCSGLWRVSVEDQGPGVPAAERERIFERFARSGSAPSDDQGSGLGLPISRRIIALHRGRIWAEPGCAGGGLKVLFEIPLGAPAAASRPAPPSAAALLRYDPRAARVASPG
ncbi:MAG: HAMP domain-containing sensor histidine kinase [Steroidobacteraceae bacterium]